MKHRSSRRRAVVTALALATMAAAAACTSAGPAAPVPTTTGALPGVTSPAPAAPPADAAEPVRRPSPRPTSTTTRTPTGSGCLGAVVHRIDASDNGPPWKRLCMTVGGVLLVTNLGPEGFSADSRDKVECNYEAAVRECRLLRTGTVRFTITNAQQTRTLTLRIVKASSPAAPAPACTGPRATFTIDAADDGPDRWPVCMRTSGVVRVVNLGPEGFQVSPAGAVTCHYEGGVRECRFTRPGTVTFTTTHGDAAPRTQKIVAIR